MPNSTQRAVSRILGDGAGHRLDYSGHQLTRKVPGSVQELDALRMEAHDSGPGSAAWADYHHLLQAGLDRDALPEAGGGVPRDIADTALEIHSATASQQQYFQLSRIDPLLLNQGWNGVSFADMGPEAARLVVAEQMSQAAPHERSAWLAVSQALDNSATTSMGVSYEAPEPGLEWHAPGADDNASDPSGLSQYFAGRDGQESSLSRLFIQNAQGGDPRTWGVDMSTTGAGGGQWHADLQRAQEAAAMGQPVDFNQGDAVLDVVSPL